jgi:hypothetical protein
VRALIVLILAGLLGAARTARAQHPDTAALERELPRLMEIGDVPGLSIAVLDGGDLSWSGAFGTLGDSAGTPVNEETIFSAASLSKPVFAYVVLRLAERDLIDLDRPLAQALDEPRITHDPRGRRITPRMVLSHGTGLPNWGGERLELQFDPGTGFGYSGEGFVYLQRAVEILLDTGADNVGGIQRAEGEGLLGVFGEAVTAHEISQRANARFDFVSCALNLAYQPTERFTGLIDDYPQPISTLIDFKPLVPYDTVTP